MYILILNFKKLLKNTQLYFIFITLSHLDNLSLWEDNLSKFYL